MSDQSLAALLGPTFASVDEMLSDLSRGEYDFSPSGVKGVRLANPPHTNYRGLAPIDPPAELLAKLGVKQFNYEATNAILKITNQPGSETHAPSSSSDTEYTESEDPEADVKQSLFLFDCEEFDQWSTPTEELLAEITAAPWQVVDVETTGLVEASKPVNLSNKELRAGDDPDLRLRIITVSWWDREEGKRLEAFDMDAVLQHHGREVFNAVCAATMTGAIIGHNVGFDMYWLGIHTPVRPDTVIDTMLLGRLVAYDLPIRLAEIVGERDPEQRHFYYDSARNIFLNKGAGTWSLETFCAVLLNDQMEKGYQKPKHWTRAVLSKEHYDYATSDVDYTYRLVCHLLDIEDGEELLEAYQSLRQERRDVRMVEPQVGDVLTLRMKGIPVDHEQAVKFSRDAFAKAEEYAGKMAEIEPELEPFKLDLADPSKGLQQTLKAALCEAFEKRGVPVLRTDKTSEPKVGEKDLRLAGAERIEAAIPLFEAWVAVSKSKKAGNMALDVKAFSERSSDLRLHPLLGHGPVTGRLSSAEPNSQQFPGDPNFRAIVRAPEGFKIAACDYSALDVRVGSALCIRTQREINDLYETGELREDLAEAVQMVKDWEFEKLKTFCLEMEKELGEQIQYALENKDWKRRDELNHQILLHRFMRRYSEVLMQAAKKGEAEWSALREAFRLNLDIHTYTTLKMNGGDPDEIFDGLAKPEIEVRQGELKKELGGKRKGGKVANLGLLYGMKSKGFADYANKIFNMGWDVEFADQVRAQWFDAYPEVDLWHIWVELNPKGRCWLPNPDGMGNKPQEWYEAETLGGRKLVAFGMNAALSYGDQGTGADIVGTSMVLMRKRRPDVYHTLINQVHDEVVAEFPEDKSDEYAEVLAQCMSDAGNYYTGQYGVPIDADTLIGDVWLKD